MVACRHCDLPPPKQFETQWAGRMRVEGISRAAKAKRCALVSKHIIVPGHDQVKVVHFYSRMKQIVGLVCRPCAEIVRNTGRPASKLRARVHVDALDLPRNHVGRAKEKEWAANKRRQYTGQQQTRAEAKVARKAARKAGNGGR